MKNWFSAHIHLHFGIFSTSFDNVILSLIRTCVLDCEQNDWIENFFFIRYGAHGPHVRLRLLLNENVTEASIKSYLEEKVAEFIAMHPASSPFPITSQSNRLLPNWMKHGAVLYVPYIPETHRYGGSAALKIVEHQFQTSSFFSWKILDQDRGKRYELAFKMLLEALHVFFPEKERLSIFLCNNIRALLDAEAGYVASSLWKKDAELHRFMTEEYQQCEQPPIVTTMLRAYESRTNGLPSQLLNTFQDFWRGLQKKNTPESSWVKSLTSFRSDLLEITQNGNLIAAEREINVSQQILTIVASMLHMHHNRLGLHLTDECWLSYLALRIISPESEKCLFDHELSCAI